MAQVKKRYRWALSTDFVILLIFVLVCVAVYKAFILGNYYGEAVHVISEILNDSYDYQSSDGEVEPDKEGNSSSRTAYRLNEDSGSEDQLLFKDIGYGQTSLQNPESIKGDALAGIGDTKSIRSLGEANGAKTKRVRG